MQKREKLHQEERAQKDEVLLGFEPRLSGCLLNMVGYSKPDVLNRCTIEPLSYKLVFELTNASCNVSIYTL